MPSARRAKTKFMRILPVQRFSFFVPPAAVAALSARPDKLGSVRRVLSIVPTRGF
jgi:hypothetical protein